MSHSHTCLLHHFVCGVKRRQNLILPTIRPRLDEYIGGILRAESCALLAAGGTPNHSHWFVRLHPSKAPADLMRIVKSRSTGWLKDTFPEAADFAWQTGYAGFTVSRSGADAVMAYIANQEEHHRTMTFEEEYIAFLDRHGVEYDPRDLFDRPSNRKRLRLRPGALAPSNDRSPGSANTTSSTARASGGWHG